MEFRFANASLHAVALTHRSFATPHNERLEFLGDSLLNFVIAQLLYETFPEAPEGDLSRWRASLVNQTTLAEIATDLDLGNQLRLGEGEVKSGGAERPSILADALEALFGAIYLDAGFDAAKRAITDLFSERINSLDPHDVAKDAKTALQERLQARRQPLPAYRVIRVDGQAHDQVFIVRCEVPALDLAAEGRGKSRRSAEQDAAAKMLARMP